MSRSHRVIPNAYSYACEFLKLFFLTLAELYFCSMDFVNAYQIIIKRKTKTKTKKKKKNIRSTEKKKWVLEGSS